MTLHDIEQKNTLSFFLISSVKNHLLKLIYTRLIETIYRIPLNTILKFVFEINFDFDYLKTL